MGKNTKYIAQVGIYEALTAAMNPDAVLVSARRAFDRQNGAKDTEDFLNTEKNLQTVSPK